MNFLVEITIAGLLFVIAFAAVMLIIWGACASGIVQHCYILQGVGVLI